MHDESYKNRTYVRYPWWSYVKNLLMQYGWALENRAHVLTDAQMDAICRTIDATMALPSGAEVLRVVEMVLIKKTHTIAGAALAVPVSESTAKRWHGNFIRALARELGLYDDGGVRYGVKRPTSAENL